MKKVILSMMAVAAALLMSSCVKEAQLSNVEGDEVAVTFGLDLVNGASTKAYGDGTTVNKLVYAIFNQNGELITTTVDSNEGQVVRDVDEWPYKETVNLAKGQSYTFVFWAQSSETDAYKVSNDMKLTIDYAGLNNDENRDAFYKVYVVEKVTRNTEIDVELERPFAQLNVGVTEADWNNAVASGINVLNSSVKLADVATRIDLFTDTVDAASVTAIEYTLNTIPRGNDEQPAEVLKNVTINGEAKNYVWLSMSYVLPLHRSNPNLLEGLEFTFDPESGNDYVLNEGLNNVPIQANYRTNIVGQILTGTIDFNISIDPIFDGEKIIEINGSNDATDPKTYGVSSLNAESELEYYETLREALDDNAAEIHLAVSEEPYTLNGNIANDVKIVGASKDVVIEYTTSVAMSGVTAEFENVTVVAPTALYTGLQHSGAVTFNDCVIENTYWCYSGEEKTVFNNCTFKCSTDNAGELVYNVWTYGSNVDFNNCTFECAGKSVLVYTEGGDVWETVNFNGCKFYASAPAKDGKAAIEIDSSLNPCNVNIENCTAEGFDLGSKSGNSLYNLKKGEYNVNCNLTVKLADGASFVNGEYVLSNAAGFAWFAEQVKSDLKVFRGKTVALGEDVALKGWTSVEYRDPEYALTFDGRGNTISNLAEPIFSEATVNVKNLNIVDSKIFGAGSHKGTIAAKLYGNIENCTAKNVVVESTSALGIRVAALVGFHNSGNMTNCHAENVVVKGYHSVGGLVGCVNETSNRVYDNCTVKGADLTVTCTTNPGATQIGAIAGFSNGVSLTLKGCKAESVTINGEASDVLCGKNGENVTIE